ncbi:MAG: TolC family protein, partial [Rhodospirillaceae bacterium]|nr:TolC family protein [Rhodospirillaceae bacterium]
RIETALFVLYQELLHDVEVAATLRDRMLPLLESALADTRRAYELGRTSYFELSTLQSELLQARNELLETSIDAHGLVVEIERLTGVPVVSPAGVQ